MAGVDTSSYPTAASLAAAPQPANPLTTLAGLAGLQHQGLQNQLIQRTMAAQQARGAAIQAATGQDGVVDTAKAGALIAANPNAAYGAPEAMDDLQAQKQAQVAQQQAQMELGWKRAQMVSQYAGSLADDPNPTRAKAAGQIGELVSMGVLSAPEGANEIKGIPDDPTQIPAWARMHQMNAMSAMDQIATHHANTMVDTGAVTQPVNTAPLAAPPTLTNTLSPGQAASPVTGPATPDGAPTTTTLGQRSHMGTIVTGPSPEQSATGTVTGQGNAQQALEMQKEANAAPQTRATLKNMSDDLARGAATGPSSGAVNTLHQFMGQFGLDWDSKAGSATAQFHKNAEMLVQARLSALGGNPTDAKLGSASSSNPGMAFDGMSNQGLIGTLQGLTDYSEARNKAYQQYKSSGGKANFGRWSAVTNDHFDPRVYQYQYLDKSDRQVMLKNMSDAQKQSFQANLKAAITAGDYQDGGR